VDLTDIPRANDDWGQVMNPAGYIPARRRSRFALGVDLGQTIDPTALCVVEKIEEPTDPPVIGTDMIQQLQPPRYECRWLERLPLQTAYPAVIAHVARLLSAPPLRGNCDLVIDHTGVGRPIFDMFVAAGLSPVGITITGGQDNETRAPGGGGVWRVSKLVLVSRLQALFHARELRIARGLPEASVLAMELQDFRATISDAGFASFGARVGKHDDLVLSLAVACWHLVGPRVGHWSAGPLPWEG
jgi:hypothetical protein